MSKKTIQWIIAITLLTVLVFIADLLVNRHHK